MHATNLSNLGRRLGASPSASVYKRIQRHPAQSKTSSQNNYICAYICNVPKMLQNHEYCVIYHCLVWLQRVSEPSTGVFKLSICCHHRHVRSDSKHDTSAVLASVRSYWVQFCKKHFNFLPMCVGLMKGSHIPAASIDLISSNGALPSYHFNILLIFITVVSIILYIYLLLLFYH